MYKIVKGIQRSLYYRFTNRTCIVRKVINKLKVKVTLSRQSTILFHFGEGERVFTFLLHMLQVLSFVVSWCCKGTWPFLEKAHNLIFLEKYMHMLETSGFLTRCSCSLMKQKKRDDIFKKIQKRFIPVLG